MRTLDKRVVGTLLAATVGLTSATIVSGPAEAAPPARIKGVVSAAEGGSLVGIRVAALARDDHRWCRPVGRGRQRRHRRGRALQRRQDGGGHVPGAVRRPVGPLLHRVLQRQDPGRRGRGHRPRQGRRDARPGTRRARRCGAPDRSRPGEHRNGNRGRGGHGVRGAGRRLDPLHHHHDRGERAVRPGWAAGWGVQARLPRPSHRCHGVLERQGVPRRRRHPERPERRVQQRAGR